MSRSLSSLLCALLLLPVVAPAAASAATTPMLGVHAETVGDESRLQATRSYESIVGRDVEVTNIFKSTRHDLSNIAEEQAILDAGHTLMISWRATAGEGGGVPARAAEIADGQHDAYLTRFARGLAKLDGRVLLRWHWEMDQEPGLTQHIGTPTEYRAAWRHVHGLVGRIAPDVEWVWAPRARGFNKALGDGGGRDFWPGSQYVDFIGGSAVPVNSLDPPGAIFDAVAGFARQHGRPLLVWVGVPEHDPAWKPGFIDDLRAKASAGASAGGWRDVLGALVYYHSISPGRNGNPERNYRADSSSWSRARMRALVCDPVFGPSSQCGTTGGGTGGGTGGSTGGGGSTGATDLFVDDDSSIHEADIDWLAQRGVTKGCNPPTNDRFCPGDVVTRAQMATFLTRALGLKAGAESFRDVASGDTHAAGIGALARAGITKGCNPPTNDRFCPNDGVTRAQMATFLRRALS